jgi:hypothetical protein
VYLNVTCYFLPITQEFYKLWHFCDKMCHLMLCGTFFEHFKYDFEHARGGVKIATYVRTCTKGGGDFYLHPQLWYLFLNRKLQLKFMEIKEERLRSRLTLNQSFVQSIYNVNPLNTTGATAKRIWGWFLPASPLYTVVFLSIVHFSKYLLFL